LSESGISSHTIDLKASPIGYPAGITAVLARLTNDGGPANAALWLGRNAFSQANTARCQVAGVITDDAGLIPVASDGTIYHRCPPGGESLKLSIVFLGYILADTSSTQTPTITPTKTSTSIYTPTRTYTFTATPTGLNTPTRTSSPTKTNTLMPTVTPTPNIPSTQLKNSGFESGNLWGWSSQGASEAQVRQSSYYGVNTPEGSYMCGWRAYQIGSRLQTLYQSIDVQPDAVYEFSMQIYTFSGGNPQDVSIRLVIDPIGNNNFSQGTSWTETNGSWQTIKYTFIASEPKCSLGVQMGHADTSFENILLVDNAKIITVSDVLRGDANCDSNITPGDALLAFQFYLKTTVPETTPCDQAAAADWDGNGNITPGDALCIFREYLKNPC